MSILSRDRQRLLEILTRISFQKKKVILASGKESDFYIDCRKTALLAEGHFLIGRLFFEAIRAQSPEARGVGGMTLGADPLASAVSFQSFLAGHPMPAFLVRKEAKGHGLGQCVEGRTNLEDGVEVAIVEDVVTTGGSTLSAIAKVEAEGLKVKRAFALVDRLEGGREAIETKGYALTSLFTRDDFMS